MKTRKMKKNNKKYFFIGITILVVVLVIILLNLTKNTKRNYDGEYLGDNNSYLKVATNAHKVTTIEGRSYGKGVDGVNEGYINGVVNIKNGEAILVNGDCIISFMFTANAIGAMEETPGQCGGLNASFGGVYGKVQNNRPVSPTKIVNLIDSSILPIKIVDTNVATENIGVTEGRSAPCQPDFFDPKISKFYKTKTGGSPAETYTAEGVWEGVGMMIDGWDNEGEDKIDLPSPYKVTVYEFGCASNYSWVLDLYKNNQRQALYTHVLHYFFSDDGKILYLVNNINNAGKWELHNRIINLERQNAVEVPNIDCVSSVDGLWQGDRLLTYSKMQVDSMSGTKVCIWDKEANLLSNMETTSAWGAASSDFLAEPIGLLPKNPNIFYAYTSKNDSICSLFMIDITQKKLIKSIDIIDQKDYPEGFKFLCREPEVKFDFSNTNFDGGTVRYKIGDGSWQVKKIGD